MKAWRVMVKRDGLSLPSCLERNKANLSSTGLRCGVLENAELAGILGPTKMTNPETDHI